MVVTQSYRYRIPGSWGAHTRDEWLSMVLSGTFKPKPPEWWLAAEESDKGRNRRTASIIWARNYDTSRRCLIWSQAPEEDFRRLGYFE